MIKMLSHLNVAKYAGYWQAYMMTGAMPTVIPPFQEMLSKSVGTIGVLAYQLNNYHTLGFKPDSSTSVLPYFIGFGQFDYGGKTYVAPDEALLDVASFTPAYIYRAGYVGGLVHQTLATKNPSIDNTYIGSSYLYMPKACFTEYRFNSPIQLDAVEVTLNTGAYTTQLDPFDVEIWDGSNWVSVGSLAAGGSTSLPVDAVVSKVRVYRDKNYATPGTIGSYRDPRRIVFVGHYVDLNLRNSVDVTWLAFVKTKVIDVSIGLPTQLDTYWPTTDSLLATCSFGLPVADNPVDVTSETVYMDKCKGLSVTDLTSFYPFNVDILALGV